MATSHDSATSQDQGECVVCGKSSSTRCSECAKFGTDWMYFCGREHQKIIWKVHKRVCGDKSNPFRFPLLSNEEVRDFTTSAQKPLEPSHIGSTLVKSWLDEFMLILGQKTRESMQASGYDDIAIFKESMETYTDAGLMFMPTREIETEHIMKIRRDRWRTEVRARTHATGEDPVDISWNLIESDPFGCLANIQHKLPLPKFGEEPGGFYERWWTVFQHKTLIRLAIVGLDKREPSEEHKAYRKYTESVIEKFAKTTTSEVYAIVGPFLMDLSSDPSLN